MRILGTIAITIFGLFAIIMAFVLMVQMSTIFFGTSLQESLRSLLLLAAGILGVSLFGYWLVAQRHSLAARLFPETDLALGVGALDLLRVALVVMGLSLIVSSLPSLLGQLGLLLQHMQHPSPLDLEMPYYPVWQIAWYSVGYSVELVVGIVLIRRSESAARWLWEQGRIDLRST